MSVVIITYTAAPMATDVVVGPKGAVIAQDDENAFVADFHHDIVADTGEGIESPSAEPASARDLLDLLPHDVARGVVPAGECAAAGQQGVCWMINVISSTRLAHRAPPGRTPVGLVDGRPNVTRAG